MADNPSWLGGAANTTTPTAQPAATSGGGDSGGGGAKYKNIVVNTLSFLNIGFSILLAATGALGVGSANSIDDTGIIFVGLYMVLFGIILFFFELNNLKAIDSLDNIYKRNFGFMYGPKGKASFLFL